MNVSQSYTGINTAILSFKVPGMTLCVSFEMVREATQVQLQRRCNYTLSWYQELQ